MNQNLKITYTYQHKETGDRLQRTFTLSEIKAGEDDAHLAIIPGYEIEKISTELECILGGTLCNLVNQMRDTSKIDLVVFDDVLGQADDAIMLWRGK
jgi:hypothetical protein